MTIHEVSSITGVTVRTLQYYDKIGLLPAIGRTDSKYRIYDESSLERLQQILLFRSLEFPLKDIKEILDAPDFDRSKALEQQIDLLTLRKEHIENLIILAKGLKARGVKHMEFKAFDTEKIDDYMKQAKESWGKTPEFKEWEEKSKNYTPETKKALENDMMKLFEEFAAMRGGSPTSEEAQAQAARLQQFITDNFYTCSDTTFLYLGKMYAGGGDFTDNIDKTCGEGTAEFVCRVITAYVGRK